MSLKSEILSSSLVYDTAPLDSSAQNAPDYEILPSRPVGQMPPEDAQLVASEVIDSALSMDFFSVISEIPEEDRPSRLEYTTLNGQGGIAVHYSQTEQGRELRIHSGEGFVDLSDKKGMPVVDVKVGDELVSSTPESAELVHQALERINNHAVSGVKCELKQGEEKMIVKRR